MGSTEASSGGAKDGLFITLTPRSGAVQLGRKNLGKKSSAEERNESDRLANDLLRLTDDFLVFLNSSALFLRPSIFLPRIFRPFIPGPAAVVDMRRVESR